jgi:hypothetical protein
MNNLPTEILLKIFSKIPCKYFNEYNCELKLKLVCKKWNGLIKKYGINLETDYSSTLVLKYTFLEVYDFNWDKILEFYKRSNRDSEIIEKFILKTPFYQLYLYSNAEKNYLDSYKIMKFWNKHVKSVHLRKYTGECVYGLTGLRSLIIEDTLINIQLMKNKSILKNIYFIGLDLKYKELFEILDVYPNLIRIEFINCRFKFSEKEKLSDIFNKPFKNEINIYFYICNFTKREFNINDEEPFNSYYSTSLSYSIDRVLFTLKNGKWERFNEFVSNEPFFYYNSDYII